MYHPSFPTRPTRWLDGSRRSCVTFPEPRPKFKTSILFVCIAIKAYYYYTKNVTIVQAWRTKNRITLTNYNYEDKLILYHNYYIHSWLFFFLYYLINVIWKNCFKFPPQICNALFNLLKQTSSISSYYLHTRNIYILHYKKLTNSLIGLTKIKNNKIIKKCLFWSLR